MDLKRLGAVSSHLHSTMLMDCCKPESQSVTHYPVLVVTSSIQPHKLLKRNPSIFVHFFVCCAPLYVCFSTHRARMEESVDCRCIQRAGLAQWSRRSLPLCVSGAVRTPLPAPPAALLASATWLILKCRIAVQKPAMGLLSAVGKKMISG